MKSKMLIFFVILACWALGVSSAAADSNVALSKPVTLIGTFFQGGWGGGQVVDKATIVDGLFLPRHNQWDQGPVWWDEYNGRPHAYIEINLGQLYLITGFIVQADDNDAYRLSYWDGSAWQVAWDIPNYDAYGWGMQTRPDPADDTARYLLPAPIVTDKLLFEARVDQSVDKYFSVSEIQAFGSPVPVPGSLLLVASGLLGLAVRRWS